MLEAGGDSVRVPDTRDMRPQHDLVRVARVERDGEVEAPVAAQPTAREALPAAVLTDLDDHRPASQAAGTLDPAVDRHHARPDSGRADHGASRAPRAQDDAARPLL